MNDKIKAFHREDLIIAFKGVASVKFGDGGFDHGGYLLETGSVYVQKPNDKTEYMFPASQGEEYREWLKGE